MLLQAHPHTFMDMRATILTDATGITGLEIEWRFDFVFSTETYYDCDWNQDGLFDEEEMEYLEYSSFSNLENYNYFTFIHLNGETIRPEEYRNLRAVFKGENLTYHFVIPVSIPFSEIETLDFAIYDETYFCDLAYFDEQPVQISGAGSHQLTATLADAEAIVIEYDNSVIRSQREGAVYSGQFVPKLIQVKRKGL